MCVSLTLRLIFKGPVLLKLFRPLGLAGSIGLEILAANSLAILDGFAPAELLLLLVLKVF